MKFDIKKIFGNFDVEGEVLEFNPIASGHINDTFLIDSGKGSFVLQRINHEVFKNPAEVVANKVRVVQHLKSKCLADPSNTNGIQFLTFRRSRNGGFVFTDADGNSWNLMDYIENSRVHLKTPNSNIAFEAGKAFGNFLRLTEDLDPSLLKETLPKFHSMSLRYAQFDRALENASEERLTEAADLIATADELRAQMHVLEEWIAEGTIPFRVTHNDTKLSNALFSVDDKAICVIDLDTVMPGIVHYDFGDAVRTICSGTDEDEPDESKIDFNLAYFESFVKGFVSESGIGLNEVEASGLALSGKIMTFIIGLRFLTDYLNNDIYFDTKYDHHNLVRARNQFLLAGLIERHLETMNEIVMKEWRGLRSEA